MGCSIQEPKVTISNQSLGLEASPSNSERALSLQLSCPMSLRQLVVDHINGYILCRVGFVQSFGWQVLRGRNHWEWSEIQIVKGNTSDW